MQKKLFSELNLAAEILKAEILTQLPLPQHRKPTSAPLHRTSRRL